MPRPAQWRRSPVSWRKARWPQVRIILRADSGFAREALMAWCEANGVDFIFGLARNARLGTVRNSVCEAIMMEGKGASYGYRERPAGPTFSWA